MTQYVKLEAKSRLLGSSILDADIDKDSRQIVEDQAEEAKEGVDEASKSGDPEAKDRYTELMNEMDTALSDPSTLTANDTSDFPGMTVADPSLGPWHHDIPSGEDAMAVDDQMLMDKVLPEGNHSLNAGLFNAEEIAELKVLASGSCDYEALEANGDAVEHMLGSTEDPVGDGDAFDMLVDGDPSQDEPIVQELTNDDGSMELTDDQELLRDDVSTGPPTL